MKIALIMDASQSGKNAEMYALLKASAEKHGHEVDNYGQFSPDEPHKVTTITNALLSSVVIASGAADFVITGCANGVGASMAMNAMPNLTCGIINDPANAYLFSHRNAGNCVCMPFAKGYGWAGEIHFAKMFDNLLTDGWRTGSDEANAEMERQDRETLADIKAASTREIAEILQSADDALIRQAFGGREVMGLLFQYCTDDTLVHLVNDRLNG